jgi:UDP-N-acetylmuramoyl-L-alanyl-D-glutamate--2,6-diaminopimelate ligase
MRLANLLSNLEHIDFKGDPEIEITGLAYDSRQVKEGYLFVALKGNDLDGHDYLGDAVQRGAVALVMEAFNGTPEKIAAVRVSNSRKALSSLAARFYEEPAAGLSLVGITGTNGKTTTSYLLESILMAAGAKPGVIGTINYRLGGRTYPAPVTTPESLDIMRLLREMADEGVTDVIMEVSSHALDQNRTADCPFKIAVFTNLSRDHLDYHQTMEAYFRAKSRLFSGLSAAHSDSQAYAVINQDDPKGNELIRLTQAPVMTYGLGTYCDFRADGVSADYAGITAQLTTPVGAAAVRSPLLGTFNIYNILAAAGAAVALGIALEDVITGIEQLRVVPGRLETVPNGRGLRIVVDYAHTPDALSKTMQTLKPLAEGKLITVFGCGGDRDKGKRYDMGLAAGQQSDLVVITSDNPRSEDPAAIIEQIEKGTRESGLPKAAWSSPRPASAARGYIIDADRRKAIRMAVGMAGSQDLVLIAGKGHEDYQIVGGERRHFDDREEAGLAASERG